MHKGYFLDHFIQIIILGYGAHSLFPFYAATVNVCPMFHGIASVGVAQQLTFKWHMPKLHGYIA